MYVFVSESLITMVINKNISAYLFYVISGVFLLFVFFALFYTYVLRLKIETAVVSAKIEAMAPPLGGYITDVLVSQGQKVKKGDLRYKYAIYFNLCHFKL